MKEKGIIEKLGITSGNYERRCKVGYVATGVELSDSDFEAVFVESKEMKKVKDAAPEMLEALISWCAWVEESGEHEAESSFIKAIETACHPKSWSEIKDLL